MPELPEVETVVRDLRPKLTGRRLVVVRRLTAVDLRQPWNVLWPPRLTGRLVSAVRRRGKWIVVELDRGFLVIHLGMTGQLVVKPPDTPFADHTHFAFDLDDGQQLRFRDSRRFGLVSYYPDEAAVQALFDETGLGPEPFELDAGGWRTALAGTARAIKAVLLDQSVVAGVGNIYADEALFEAKIHPSSRGCDLTRPQAERLRKAIVTVLQRAIEHGGSTIRDYVGGDGQAGTFQAELRVYGRDGEPCRRCRTPVAVVRLAGRSTHFCPTCQPAPVAVTPSSPEAAPG
ncbi:MAG: bifunctional DNA-formamidopyrimidine glycosylase/DNA-(apurinic or apyrimidinic site) lyase [Gemmataceae bacterium]